MTLRAGVAKTAAASNQLQLLKRILTITLAGSGKPDPAFYLATADGHHDEDQRRVLHMEMWAIPALAAGDSLITAMIFKPGNA